MPKQFGTPGPRALWPSIATSAPLGACSIQAQLLFERLIVQADDQGRMIGDPVFVAGVCVPLVRRATPRNVGAWLTELERNDLITRYEAKGQQLIQLRNWWDHQGGQRHIWPSRWPAPKGWVEDQIRGHGLAAGPSTNGRPAPAGSSSGPPPGDSGPRAGDAGPPPGASRAREASAFAGASISTPTPPHAAGPGRRRAGTGRRGELAHPPGTYDSLARGDEDEDDEPRPPDAF